MGGVTGCGWIGEGAAPESAESPVIDFNCWTRDSKLVIFSLVCLCRGLFGSKK